MKKLSLVNLYKAEIKKSMLIQIKGGGEIRCVCNANLPSATVHNIGDIPNQICFCKISSPSSGIQKTPA